MFDSMCVSVSLVCKNDDVQNNTEKKEIVSGVIPELERGGKIHDTQCIINP